MVDFLDMDRRTGDDRRGSGRSDDERRGPMAKSEKYIQLIKKIPIFSGLRIDQFKKLIRIIAWFNVDGATTLFHAGDEAQQMYILVKGSLKVVFEDGKVLSRITPVGLVGEMGVFTGEVRSASVIAEEDSIILGIHRNELMRLFRMDSDIGIHILTNVIREISHKLKKGNVMIDELRYKCFPGDYSKILADKDEPSETADDE